MRSFEDWRTVVAKATWYLLVNNVVSPDSPFPTKAAAEAARDKRKAHDQRVDPPISYEYLVVSDK
jgi:hypothetical protein